MKKLLPVLFLLLSNIFLNADVLSETVATVNLIKPEMITSNQVKKEIEDYNRQLVKNGLPRQDISKDEMLENMISSILILQAAERDGIQVSGAELQKVVDAQKKSVESQIKKRISMDQFKQIVENQTDLSWDDYIKNLKEQMIKQTYVTKTKREYFTSIKVPTEEEIETRYQENITKFVSPEYIRASMVYVNTINKNSTERAELKKKIDEAYAKLKNGQISFDDAVLNYSTDDTIKYRGGDIGYIRRDDKNTRARLGEKFFNKLFSLKVNEISEVLESNTGYHIVKITEKRAPKVLALNDPINPGKSLTVHDFLKTGIYQEREQMALQKALKEVVAELKAEAEITIF